MAARCDSVTLRCRVAYKEMGERYRMPEDLMVRGQVCATLFPEDNNWHRGIITGWSHRMVEVCLMCVYVCVHFSRLHVAVSLFAVLGLLFVHHYSEC